MKQFIHQLARLPLLKDFLLGRSIRRHPAHAAGRSYSQVELGKRPSRTEIINFLLSHLDEHASYLEIGVRNPEHNFQHIRAKTKFSVDPGLEFVSNPVDFKMTSDAFFDALRNAKVLSPEMRFGVIFIDGLHLADQVDRDIQNALDFIREDGFIVLHDCNPPTCWHAREEYTYYYTPAQDHWNGTTWKAYLKWRHAPGLNSCCIDSDWGVGIISKTQPLGRPAAAFDNPYFEYAQLEKNRNQSLNLKSFPELQALMTSATGSKFERT